MKPLLFSALLFPLGLFAQTSTTTTWFPPGARWHYEYLRINGPGHAFIEYAGTDSVGGQAVVRLHRYNHHLGNAINQPVYEDEGFELVFSRNDSVFLWRDNAFVLLYDFTRQVGDTMSFPGNFPLVPVVLDGLGDTVVQGIPVRFQRWDLGGQTYFRVYERLGGAYFFEPGGPNLPGPDYNLLCYRDDEYPLEDCLPDLDTNYVPFPTGTAMWSEHNWADWEIIPLGRQYLVQGDTFLPPFGMPVRKVYYRRTFIGDSIINQPFHFIGVMDQDVLNKKVWFMCLTPDWQPFSYCLEMNPPLGEFILLYDFDLEIGDTLTWKPLPNVVAAIDSIQLLDGSWRRTFAFQDDAAGFLHRWIEGIGSVAGLFNSYQNETADAFASCNLVCFHADGELSYKPFASVSCDSGPMTPAREPLLAPGSFRLRPNPAAAEATVTVPADVLPALLRIRDLHGRLLETRTITAPETLLRLPPGARPGILLLTLQTPGGRPAVQRLTVLE